MCVAILTFKPQCQLVTPSTRYSHAALGWLNPMNPPKDHLQRVSQEGQYVMGKESLMITNYTRQYERKGNRSNARIRFVTEMDLTN